MVGFTDYSAMPDHTGVSDSALVLDDRQMKPAAAPHPKADHRSADRTPRNHQPTRGGARIPQGHHRPSLPATPRRWTDRSGPYPKSPSDRREVLRTHRTGLRVANSGGGPCRACHSSMMRSPNSTRPSCRATMPVPISRPLATRIPESAAADWAQRLSDLADEFAAQPRSGETTFGVLLGLFPTGRRPLPTDLPDDSDET